MGSALTGKASGSVTTGDRRAAMREAADWLSGLTVLFILATLILVLP